MNMDEYNYYFGNLRELNYDYMLDRSKMKFVQKIVCKNNGKNEKFGRNQRLAFIAAEKMRNKTDRYYKKLEEKTNRLVCRQTNRTDRSYDFGRVVLSIFGVIGLVLIVYFVAFGNVDFEVAFKLITGK